ncbi:hypothetical protein ONZ43_g435 [Nemania bipapillata]|uniref:Uncharacterized protein n=1 Tax=Nemania bipapillata TaxID=110536 RepID=A0ACC2J822_9PEZI|nr:hypothetical protein ONZ43_g435 [Nemania bipapillata]
MTTQTDPKNHIRVDMSRLSPRRRPGAVSGPKQIPLEHVEEVHGIDDGARHDAEHVLRMCGVALSPCLVRDRVDEPRAVVPLVEPHRDQTPRR